MNADPELRACIAAHLDTARDRARALIEANLGPVIDFADVLLNLRILEGEELDAALRGSGCGKREDGISKG